MVALDDGGIAEAGLDHVGVNGTLDEEIDLADFFGLGFKDADELLADDLALGLGLGYARKLREEAVLGVHADKVDIPLGERRFDLVALILAHETVIDEDAGQLISDGLGHERGRDGGVYAARERQQRLARADLFADGADCVLPVIGHGPVAGRLADAI